MSQLVKHASAALRSRWTPLIAGTLLLIGGMLIVAFVTEPKATSTPNISSDYSLDMTVGPQDASVVVVEYADFECAPCAAYETSVRVIRDEYSDRVLFVYRFLPLEGHQHAMIAARAAYAASMQGQFWSMHDMLFDNQKEWSASEDAAGLFEEYARALGLDLDRFRIDLYAQTSVAFVEKQKEEAMEAGVDFTPWVMVNGVQVPSQDADALVAAIETALQ